MGLLNLEDSWDISDWRERRDSSRANRRDVAVDAIYLSGVSCRKTLSKVGRVGEDREKFGEENGGKIKISTRAWEGTVLLFVLG